MSGVALLVAIAALAVPVLVAVFGLAAMFAAARWSRGPGPRPSDSSTDLPWFFDAPADTGWSGGSDAGCGDAGGGDGGSCGGGGE